MVQPPEAAEPNGGKMDTLKRSIIYRKKLVKCYIWSIALYGAETGTVGQ